MPGREQPVDVNRAPGEKGDCDCDEKTWANIMVCLSITGMGLVVTCAILNLMDFENGVPGVMLDLYLVILALLGVAAELRMFKPLRGPIYIVIRYVYFLTSYYSRAMYYFFLGTLILDVDKPLMVIAAIFNGCVAICYPILHFKYKFPKYLDWQVVKAEQEEKLRRDVQQRFTTASTSGTPVAAAAAHQQAQLAKEQATQQAQQTRDQAHAQAQNAHAQVQAQAQQTRDQAHQQAQQAHAQAQSKAAAVGKSASSIEVTVPPPPGGGGNSNNHFASSNNATATHDMYGNPRNKPVGPSYGSGAATSNAAPKYNSSGGAISQTHMAGDDPFNTPSSSSNHKYDNPYDPPAI